MEVGVKLPEVKELNSLIHFWQDGLAEHRLLMSPSIVYLVEQTIKSLETLGSLAADGLFVARLNNGVCRPSSIDIDRPCPSGGSVQAKLRRCSHDDTV